MDKRIDNFYEWYMNDLKAAAPAYGLLYFDHLYSEYLALKASINNPASLAIIDALHKRRIDGDPPLTWNDIYVFDLELLKYLPPEELLRKAYDMRSKYRKVVGQQEYELYIASKPPDLATVKVTPAQPPTSAQLDPALELALREDIKYLLNIFYLNYSLMPVREGVREQLTRKGVKWTLWSLVVITIFIIFNRIVGQELGNTVYALSRGTTLGVVVAAGFVGGLMSMLQRIQSAPSEGDALFNLASLTNGWRSIFLAPLTGAVFAVLLFVLFAGGILKGTVFPDIYTPDAAAGQGPLPQLNRQTTPSPQSTPTPSPKPENESTPTPSPSGTSAPTPTATSTATPPAATNTTNATPSPTVAKSTPPTPTPTVSPGPTPSATPATGNSVTLTRFLRETGPSSGLNYALLIIWSFIAGFAERLVPDTLSRLVAKSNVNG